jgi:hypothetical protein
MYVLYLPALNIPPPNSEPSLALNPDPFPTNTVISKDDVEISIDIIISNMYHICQRSLTHELYFSHHWY